MEPGDDSPTPGTGPGQGSAPMGAATGHRPHETALGAGPRRTPAVTEGEESAVSIHPFSGTSVGGGGGGGGGVAAGGTEGRSRSIVGVGQCAYKSMPLTPTRK